MFDSRADHPPADPAVFQEIPLQPPEFAVEEVVRLVDQADRDVGNRLRRPRLAELAELAEVLVSDKLSVAEPSDKQGFAGVLVPERMIADAEIVFVVPEQFLEARARHIVSLSSVSVEGRAALLASRMFCFPERAAWIIWSMVRSFFLRKLWQKAERDVIDNLRLLKREQFPIVPVRREKSGIVFHKSYGTYRTYLEQASALISKRYTRRRGTFTRCWSVSHGAPLRRSSVSIASSAGSTVAARRRRDGSVPA